MEPNQIQSEKPSFSIHGLFVAFGAVIGGLVAGASLLLVPAVVYQLLVYGTLHFPQLLYWNNWLAGLALVIFVKILNQRKTKEQK